MALPPTVNVLFVSRRNTARSVLAESCLNHLDHRRFNAFSCGMPGEVGATHPSTVKALSDAGMGVRAGPGHDWRAFLDPSAKRMAFVIVLADDLGAALPAWPGQPNTATWAYPDPLAASLHPEQSYRLMIHILHSLRRRIEIFVSLPMHRAERATLRDDVRDLAHLDRLNVDG